MFPWMPLPDSLEAESFREKFCDLSLFGALSAQKKDCRLGAEFINHLTARSTRGTGHFLFGNNGYGANLDLWTKLRYG
jgi:hypothetical protein